MHLGEMTVNFPRGPQAPVLIGEGGAVTRRSLGMGAYCPSPRVWVAGYGCLDPSNSAGKGVDLQVDQAPMGPDTGVNLMDPGQPLTREARAIIESAGHTIDCQRVGRTVLCSVDGGEYRYQAMVLNRNPAQLLQDLGHGPTAYAYQQGVRSQLRNLTLPAGMGDLGFQCPSGTRMTGPYTCVSADAPAGAPTGWQPHVPQETDLLWVPVAGGFAPVGPVSDIVGSGMVTSPTPPPWIDPATGQTTTSGIEQARRAVGYQPPTAVSGNGQVISSGDQGVVVASVQEGPRPTASEAVGASEGVAGALDALSVGGLPGWAILAAGAGALWLMNKGKG